MSNLNSASNLVISILVEISNLNSTSLGNLNSTSLGNLNSTSLGNLSYTSNQKILILRQNK